MTEVKFKNRRLNTKKLATFGFGKTGSDYIYYRALADGQLKLTVKIDPEERIYTEVVDNISGDEYVLHLVADAVGSFVGQVKSEYKALLEEISAKCFDIQVFKSSQAKAVIAYIRDKYGDELEYLWEKFPDNAVVRRKDNRKWYAAILTVSRRKLGFDSDEIVEIIDLRMTPEDIGKLVDGVKILPGYHMNKKHWITVCLDGSVPLKDICRKTDESYLLAKKQ